MTKAKAQVSDRLPEKRMRRTGNRILREQFEETLKNERREKLINCRGLWQGRDQEEGMLPGYPQEDECSEERAITLEQPA